MAWRKASPPGWRPGLGGISTRPSAFSRKAVSRRPMIAGMSRAMLSTSARDKYKRVEDAIDVIFFSAFRF
jgi:hypothetical protein